MKPLIHAKGSVRKHGGSIEDYLDIHNFLDSSKAHHADIRHRAMLHNSFGCYLAEQLFGVYFQNSDGRDVSVRDICEEHILEDMGDIPPVSRYLDHMPMYHWLGGKKRKKGLDALEKEIVD